MSDDSEWPENFAIIGWVDAEHSTIHIRVDDRDVFVPNDMANRHRRMIAEWEAQGNTIPDYVAPAPEA